MFRERTEKVVFMARLLYQMLKYGNVKHLIQYFLIIVLITSLGVLSYWVFVPDKSEASLFESPIPSFLTIPQNSQIKLLDFWIPFLSSSASPDEPPTHTAKSVLIYDLTEKKSLYEHYAKKRLPMASLTKIMTAIIAIENPRPDDRYLVRGSDLVGEDSMGLLAGEKLTLEELLYGLMLPSGNDAAEVLANNYIYGREKFVEAMNNKAKALGLTDTNFTNPSGLQGDGVQYTTAYDLLVITRYALENFPLLKKIVSTYEHEISATPTHQYYHLYNETNLLTTYPGVKGVKTGYTPEAGMCLVTYLEYKDHKIIAILLNSENRREEMRNFLNYSLTSLGITPPEQK